MTVAEKVSHEDGVRAMTDAKLAESVAWADDREARDRDGRAAFVRMLADPGGMDYSRADEWKRGQIAAIRAEVERRAAGGAQCPDAVAKMARVMGRMGLTC